jgi:hypothetical protein
MPMAFEDIRRKRTERLEALRALKKHRGGCVDCGSQENLHLDHRDDETKLFDPADVSNRSWLALFAEWDKCDVRCAYCHIKRHGPRKRTRHVVCTVEGCERPHQARGFCSMHYGRVVARGRLTRGQAS